MNRDEMPSALQPFMTRNGYIRQLPRKEGARLQLLLFLAESFEPGRDYSEAEVNLLLSGHEIDYATLRRYLVDFAVLTRAHGIYCLAEPLPSANAD